MADGPVPGVAGLLLAGGASRRMGRDKAQLAVAGVTLAERAAGVLASVCRPALEVGPGHTGLEAVREDPPGSGPLAAVAAGGRALRERGHHGPALVLAVDMPRVTVELLRLLATVSPGATVVPVVAAQPQPLCARYSAEALVTAEGLVGAGERSMRALLRAVGDLRWLGPAAWGPVAAGEAFLDADTPADLARLGDEPDDAR